SPRMTNRRQPDGVRAPSGMAGHTRRRGTTERTTHADGAPGPGRVPARTARRATTTGRARTGALPAGSRGRSGHRGRAPVCGELRYLTEKVTSWNVRCILAAAVAFAIAAAPAPALADGQSMDVGPDGWTVLAPSQDSRIIYVSSSGGNDANSGLSPS